MLKISALFLFSLIALNSCLEINPIDQELLPNSSSRAKLIEMLVEVKTEANVNTISGFTDQLRSMLDKLVEAQNKHKAIHAKMMKLCTEEADFRAKEIRTARDAARRALNARTKCQASLKAAVHALPGLQFTLKTYVGELRRAKKQREAERAKFLIRQAAFRNALTFLREFTELVTRGMKAGGWKAFALAEMTEGLLKHSQKLNFMEATVPILAELASSPYKSHHYAYSPNQSLGAKLRGALSDLNNRIRHDNHLNEKLEQAAVHAFNKYSRRLTKVINTLRNNIKRVKKQIVDMTRCIENETKVLEAATRKLARNDALARQAAKMCDSFNKEFIEATYNRLDEIKTMNEICKIVARRFKHLPGDLVKYLERVKNGWIKYVNSTEFHKFKEYERKRFAVNHRGALLARLEASKDNNPVAAVVRGKHGIY